MEAKHTPGPWVYAGRPAQPGSYPQYDIGLGIWTGVSPDLDGQAHGCRGDEYMQVGGVCSEADARLIAAAPDLLSAQKPNLIRETIASLERLGEHELANNWRAALQGVETAIAKAEGR